MSRRLWNGGVGISKSRKPEERIKLWLPNSTVKADISRGDKLYREYLKRIAQEYREGRKS